MKELKILGFTILTALVLTGCGEVGKGSKIGQVVKVNESSGLFCKTVEVEIIRGGFNSGSGAQGGSLHFTIENNKNDLELVKKAMLDGSEIEVNFREEFATFCRSGRNVFSESINIVHQEDKGHIQPDSTNINSDTRIEILRALKLQNEALQKLLNKELK